MTGPCSLPAEQVETSQHFAPLSPPLLPALAHSHLNNTTNAPSLLHLIKALVNVVQVLRVRNVLVDLELAIQVLLNKAGELSTTLDASKG